MALEVRCAPEERWTPAGAVETNLPCSGDNGRAEVAIGPMNLVD